MYAQLVEKYGPHWNTQRPPQARTVGMLRNTALVTALPAGRASVSVRAAGFTVETAEVLIVTTASVKAIATVPNPHWPGFMPETLHEAFFQSRIQWKPRSGQASVPGHLQTSAIDPDGTIYNPGALVIPNSNGYSLLRAYSSDESGPIHVVEPGKHFWIQLDFFDPGLGYEMPPFPADTPVWLQVEWQGFMLHVDRINEIPLTP